MKLFFHRKPCHWRALTHWALLACALLFGANARADVCTAAPVTVAFGNISPVAGQDYVAAGTLSVTCTFIILDGNIIVLPNINGCASILPGGTAGTRALVNGGRAIPFNLYRSASYTGADVWDHYASGTAIVSTWAGLLAIGTGTQTYPVYARIAAADFANAAIDSEAGSVYTASFTGAFNYTSASIVVLPCQSSGTSAPFTVNVSANIVNDCRITATPVAFGTQGPLTGATRATGTLSVSCTRGNSYRIALNGGTVSNAPANRRMRNAATGETVAYRLSSTLDGPLWGDGSGGTGMVSSAGTGAAQQLTIFGLVPPQASPSPGDYADRVTATVYF